MTNATPSTFDESSLVRRVPVSTWVLLALIVAGAAYLRIGPLSARSLGNDEFATWYVHTLPISESLRWQPELTKPPLYQLLVRAIADDYRPAEWVLRLPAAACGILLVPAAFFLVLPTGSKQCAIAMALMVACHTAQIQYSQEARPYSLVVVTTTLATLLWFRAIVTPRAIFCLLYVVAAVAAFHSHYLAALMFPVHIAWWIVIGRADPALLRLRTPVLMLLTTAALCTPIVLHYLSVRTEVFQGLAWIAPPTTRSTLDILGQLGAGAAYLWLGVIPALAVGITMGVRMTRRKVRLTSEETTNALIVLLTAWFVVAFGALLAVSLLGRPALVLRYVLPASIPALALPLLVAGKFHRLAPVFIAIVFVIADAPRWVLQATEFEPGIRELVTYLRSNVDREKDLIVITIDNTTFAGWEDMERAAFLYYDLGDLPHEELHLGPDAAPTTDALKDPRRIWLVVGWADPFAVLRAAGRPSLPIELEGTTYQQLLFTPFRLVLVAPQRSP